MSWKPLFWLTEQMSKKPLFNREKQLLKEFDLVFGMDEVGRGCFAGPIVAAAVHFDRSYLWFKNINDSKLLTHKKRKRLSSLVLKYGICFIEIIEVETINEIGIGECNKKIFENLIKEINKGYKNKKIYFLIDGNKKGIGYKNLEYIIKGDRKHISIAAASIIAKVYRDELMKRMGKIYKGYNFGKNKGYGTRYHQNAIKKLGLCELHRKSFKLEKFL